MQDLETNPRPKMISNSTEDTHKPFISFVFMLHKINDAVQPVTDVTDRKDFQNGNIQIFIFSENLRGMAVNVAVLFPKVKMIPTVFFACILKNICPWLRLLL